MYSRQYEVILLKIISTSTSPILPLQRSVRRSNLLRIELMFGCASKNLFKLSLRKEPNTSLKVLLVCSPWEAYLHYPGN